MTNNQDLLCVAEIKSAYGIKGWSWVYSNTDPMEQLFEYSPLLYLCDKGKKNNIIVEKWRKQGKGLVVKFDISLNRNDAEALAGTKIWLNKADLPHLQTNEFYWSELENLQVINKENQCLGRVQRLFETSAHQVIVVTPTDDSIDSEERLIPYHDNFVENIDINQNLMTVDWKDDY